MGETEVRVTESVRIDIEAAQGRLRNLKPVFLGPILSDLLATERGIFATAGKYAGIGGWPLLSESTMLRKGMSAELLVESGDLQASLITPHAKGQIAQMKDDTTFEFGTSIDYAPFHQVGTKYMPARPPIPEQWPDEDVKRWGDIAVEYIMEGRL